MMGNEFYNLVTIKMKLNLKYNGTVSFMETKTIEKSSRKQKIIQTDHTQIVSK